MSILRRERRSMSLSTLIADAGFATREGNEAVRADTPERAMRHATVWGCVNLIADVVSMLPIDVYRKTDNGRTIVASPPILQRPSPFVPLSAWVWQAVASLVTQGNAFGLITKLEANGYPSQVSWLDPTGVRLRKDDNGVVTYHVGKQVYDASSVVHIPAFVLPGSLVGLSPLGLFRRTVELGLRAEEHGYGWFRDGAVPSALVRADQVLDEEQSGQIKAAVYRAVNGREVLVMGAGLTYEQISVNAEESQFLETIRANAATVCQVFRVPPEMLGVPGGGSSVTYANREQRSIDFLTFTLAPWLVRLEEALTGLLPADQFVKFNVDALLRSDTMTRYQAHSIALRDGWRSRNEVRRLEDEPPIPDGDTYGQASPSGADSGGGIRDLVEMVQKVYLGVDKVLTADEARSILNRAGAGLDVPGPFQQVLPGMGGQ